MTRVLVTGGTGVLGRELTPRLQAAGHTVRILSRRPRPANLPTGQEWAQGDIETGAGLKEALAGVETIVHAATSPFTRTQQVDVQGTSRLLELARAASVNHFVHVSIVGIERIPFPYYQHKVAGETSVMNGSMPWTILRATQFHNLLDGFLQPLAKFPIGFAFTDFKFQPVDVSEVAEALVRCAGASPAGCLPDMGGPEVLKLGEMARVWLEARGKRTRVINFPLPGGFAHALRNGYNTCPENRQGKVTWAEWVRRRYGNSSQEAK